MQSSACDVAESRGVQVKNSPWHKKQGEQRERVEGYVDEVVAVSEQANCTCMGNVSMVATERRVQAAVTIQRSLSGGRRTKDKESNSRDDDPQIPQRPEICLVEHGSGVLELAEFVVRECSDPDIEKYFGHSDALRVSLNQHPVVQGKERGEEAYLNGLGVFGNS